MSGVMLAIAIASQVVTVLILWRIDREALTPSEKDLKLKLGDPPWVVAMYNDSTFRQRRGAIKDDWGV